MSLPVLAPDASKTIPFWQYVPILIKAHGSAYMHFTDIHLKMVAQSDSESSAQGYHLLPDATQCKAKYLFRSCFPPMFAYNMQPIRYSEK